MPAHNEYTTVKGDLGAFRELSKGYRWQTVLELQTDRCKDGQEALQRDWFWLPHGNVFYQTHKGLGWGFTDQARNLILKPKNIEAALVQLPATGIFRPKRSESWRAIEHKSTQRFSYAKLGLTDENKEWSYFLVTRDLSGEREEAARAVGFNSDNVDYLLAKGLRPRVCLPNPEYLTEVFSGTEENAKDPIWWASRLSGFINLSCFIADYRIVGSHDSLRGVRRRASARNEATDPISAQETDSSQFPCVSEHGAAGADAKKAVPQTPSEVKVATMEEILAISHDGYVPERLWKDYEAAVRQKVALK